MQCGCGCRSACVPKSLGISQGRGLHNAKSNPVKTTVGGTGGVAAGRYIDDVDDVIDLPREDTEDTEDNDASKQKKPNNVTGQTVPSADL